VDESHTVIENAARGDGSQVQLAHGTLLAGRYEIVRLLGRGGAGLVVRARDHVLDQLVAVKVLRPEHGAETRWIERLAKEVKLARLIRHPNVCRVFDFGQADGHAFLVMELARGSLRDELLCPEAAARPFDARLADACAVAEGLAAVHAAGIVHRDVTPQNVLRVDDGRLVVSDFGLATDTDPTASSMHGGTVAYMAPELARGAPASLASDVWALGVIIYEIAFGCRPTWREGRFHSTMESPSGRALGALERRLVEICGRCTLDPGRRRPSAAEVATLVAGVRPQAHASAAPLARRRRVVLSVALVVGLAGAASLWRAGCPAPVAASPLSVTLAGEASDWSLEARVLATVDGRINTITALPGGARARVSWGEPPRFEDVDLLTGARAPAKVPALPPGAGSPIPSPDGASVAFEGYAAGGHPFIFLSSAEPGARPVAVSAAADPSLSSEPRWLEGGRAFVFDADMRNVGVFSLDTNRATILPTFDVRPSFTMFKAAVGDRVLVARISDDFTSQLAIFSWPDMAIVSRFDVPGFAVEWQEMNGRLFGIVTAGDPRSELIEVDPVHRTGRRIGRVPGESLRALAVTGESLVFATYHYGGDVWLDDGGDGRLITSGLGAREVARGGGHVLATVRRGGGVERIIELDEQGRERGAVTNGPVDESPSILPGARAWTYTRRAGESPGFYRCVFGGPCKRLSDVVMPYATVSPDGLRVAYIDPAPQGSRARVADLAGGAPRDVGDGGSYCAPVWSSPRTLWISRRAVGTPVWTEVDIDAPGAPPTGRTLRGARACTDGLPDPAAPTRDGAKIVVNWRSELRVHPLP
jgi:CBS domain-containing protein